MRKGKSEGVATMKSANIIEVMNPVANVEKGTIPAAARLKSLDGKTIALWWNGKAKGDVALKKVGRYLEEQFDAKCRFYHQAFPHGDGVYDVVLKDGCEAAITSTGD
jgi:hypothetical protein